MDLSIFLKLLCCCIVLVKADVCVQRGPCSCVFPNGTAIDLTQSATTPVFISDPFTLIGIASNRTKKTYLFHPCYDVLIRKPYLVESCHGNWSICLYYEEYTFTDSTGDYTKNNSGYDVIGTVRHSQFASDAQGTYIHYSWPLSSKVYLSCAEGEDKLQIRRWYPDLELEFFTRNACLQRLDAPVSGLSIPRWMEMQWTKFSQAFKEGYAYVVDGLKWLVPQPLERLPSFIGSTRHQDIVTRPAPIPSITTTTPSRIIISDDYEYV